MSTGDAERIVSPEKRAAIVAMPPLLVVSTVLAFRISSQILGRKAGYLAAFVLYWVVWCLLFPLWNVGRRGIQVAFDGDRVANVSPRWQDWLLLAIPPAVGYGFAFPKALRDATIPILASSAGLALVNAIAEELLWRGVFIRAFPRRRILGWLYPTLTFGLWHLAPQTVNPASYPGGRASFVAAASVCGLIYGWVAQRTGSLRWTTVSHVLFDFAGLGDRYYFRR